MARSALGAPTGGAAERTGFIVTLFMSKNSAPPLGELLSEREAEGVRLDEWKLIPFNGRHPLCDSLSAALRRLLACIAPAGA